MPVLKAFSICINYFVIASKRIKSMSTFANPIGNYIQFNLIKILVDWLLTKILFK